MDDRSPQPASGFAGIHIPPEEAVAIAFLVLEVAANAWTRKRNALSLRWLGVRRELEFAVEHEGGFTMLLRRSKPFSRR